MSLMLHEAYFLMKMRSILRTRKIMSTQGQIVRLTWPQNLLEVKDHKDIVFQK